MDVLDFLESRGYFLGNRKKVVILRVVYRQHKFDPNNVRGIARSRSGVRKSSIP